MATDLENLIDTINKDRELAVEVLSKLPQLITEQGDITFDLDTPVLVPTVAKLQEAMSSGNIPDRLKLVEAISRGLVQESERLSSSLGIQQNSPFWDALDLKDNTDGDTLDPLFRAQVEDGIRMPYDGYTVLTIDRKFPSGAARIGDWLLPNYTENIDQRWASKQSHISVTTHAAVNTSYYWRYYYIYRYYYGYYWRWWAYRNNNLNAYKYLQAQADLSGSMMAQTFQVSSAKVLTGMILSCYAPTSYQAAANPRAVLVESSFGAPDLSKTLATGTFRSADLLQGAAQSNVNIDFDRPVLLQPNKSYALIVITDSTFLVNYSANQDNTGGLFLTQDAQYWDQDILKDWCFSLRTADFSQGGNSGTQTGPSEVLIEMNALELSGGISSTKQSLLVEIPEGTSIETEVEINGTWQPLESMNSLSSLPPHSPCRLKLIGTATAMPILDVTQSEITAFRPATELLYRSVLKHGSGNIRISYELIGFNPLYHTFDPAIMINTTRILPDVIETSITDDENVRHITATFSVSPTGVDYKHDIIGDTDTASIIYDIASIIEIKA